MNIDNKTFQDQIITFIKYCQKNPIDKTIIDETHPFVIHEIQQASSIKSCYNRTNEYMSFSTNLHTYMFQFKDIYALRSFAKPDMPAVRYSPTYSFDYDESYISLNGHDLSYVILKSKCSTRKSIFTFDKKSKRLLIRIYAENPIFLNKDICSLIDIDYASISQWQYFKQDAVPEKIQQLVLAQRTVAALL